MILIHQAAIIAANVATEAVMGNQPNASYNHFWGLFYLQTLGVPDADASVLMKEDKSLSGQP